MPNAKLAGPGLALAAAMLLIAGCGQQAPTAPDVAGSRAEATESNVPGPTAETPPEPADDRVEQAVATAPADRALPDAKPDSNEPAPLPPSPSRPLPAQTDEPLPELPLEEPLDSGTSMPQVRFSEAHAKTNRLDVGDTFPKLELANLDGQRPEFGDLVGEKLTIVLFWSGEVPSALDALAGIQTRFLDEFQTQGVAFVGVNVGDDPRLARELAEQAKATFPQLCDRDGAALAQLATERLPRTYLIDASGRILWFDIEYSRTTRQQLLSALRFSLKDE